MPRSNAALPAPERGSAPAQLLLQVETWLCTIMEHIAPMISSSVTERLWRQKCLNELAFYLNWRDLRQLPYSAEAARLSAFVVDNCSNDYLEWAGRRPQQSLVHAQTFAHAVRHGGDGAATTSRLRHLLSGRFSWHTELLACRQLELLVACRHAGAVAPIEVNAVIAASSLVLPPCPLLSDTEAFYSFAHTVFFTHLLQPDALPPSAQTVAALEGGLCRAIAASDLDLALELLLCQIVSGTPFDGGARLAYALLVNGLAGGVLSETIRLSPAQRDFLAERPEEHWAKAFHLMQLAALVLTALEQSQRQTDLLAAGDDSFALVYGRCAQHLQRHQIAAGLDEAARLMPTDALQHRLVRGIDGHVAFLRNSDGSFGRYFDERRLYNATTPDGHFGDLMLPVQDACTRHLARAATRCIGEGTV